MQTHSCSLFDLGVDAAMTNAVKRLSELEVIFTLNDLRYPSDESGIYPLSYGSAKTFVQRMIANEWVAASGPSTGFYYNLIKERDAKRNRVLEVAARLYPEAIVIGPMVLHAYGWITQIPKVYDLAVSDERRTLASIDGVNLLRRSRQWYADHQEENAFLVEGESPYALQSLTPLAALVDIQKHKDMWEPKEDDLYIPDDPNEGVVRLKYARLKSHG